MTSIPCLSARLQTLFTTTADTLAVDLGFVQRRRKLTGSRFAQALVFGWLDCSSATLRQLQQSAALAGAAVSPQALSQRCTEAGARFLQALLSTAVQTLVAGEPAAVPLLQRFPAVVVLDSTTITLPPVLRSVWRGCGGSTPTTSAAALKLQVRLDVCRGGIDVLDVTEATECDQTAVSQRAPLPVGALRLSDQGFFSVPVLHAVVAAGAHFLTRPVPQLSVQTAAGHRRSLGAFLAGQRGEQVDQAVVVGSKQPLPCRLLAVRVPDRVAEQRRAHERERARHHQRPPSAAARALAGWTVVLTSLPPEQLSLGEALVLLRVRWQVELLFKRWKSAGLDVAHWRTADPWRALCTVYAKLLAALVAQWLTAVGCWKLPDKSLHAALVGVRGWARLVVYGLQGGPRRLRETLRRLCRVLQTSVRQQRRRQHPASFQLLLMPSLQPLN